MKRLLISIVVCFVLLNTVRIGYSECEGDLNCSGGVDGTDLAIFAADFGTTGCGDCDDVIARVEELEGKIAQLEALLLGVTRDGNKIIFEAINVQIVNGTDSTDGTSNGLGNLIIGYNENTVSASRTGSHNLVLGIDHEYTSYAGLLAGRENIVSGTSSSVMGYRNEVTASYGSIIGGSGNIVSTIYSSISGGSDNEVTAAYSSVSGGRNNVASGNYSSISGGRYNEASGQYSFVGGGGDSNSIHGNNAFSNYSAILGGHHNIAGDNSNLDDHSLGEQATVSGGYFNTAIGGNSCVSGGLANIASGQYSTVSGGHTNEASGESASVSGGYDSTASGRSSSVSGGRQNEAIGESDSVSGGEDNTANGYASSVSGGRNRTVMEAYNWRAGSCYFCLD